MYIYIYIFTWILALIKAFPTNVAVKNVMNEIPQLPQIIPAKSNNGLGIEAQANIPQNPYFSINFSTFGLILLPNNFLNNFIKNPASSSTSVSFAISTKEGRVDCCFLLFDDPSARK